MKISIITTTYNSEHTIIDTIESLNQQTYKNYNLIIIDNLSSDKTLEIIKKNFKGNLKIVSEKDNGIYHALNKGILYADGEIIFILHSNDRLIEKNSLELVINSFKKFNPDVIYGNIIIENRKTKKIIRNWISDRVNLHNKINNTNSYKFKFKNGWAPPHTSLFIKKDIIKKIGQYNTNYQISSDYDYIIRIFHSDNIKTLYINNYIVAMSIGGKSTKFANVFKKMSEDYSIINKHKLGGFIVLLKKILSKIKQIR
jgi:glycosyltransferase